MKNPFIVVLVLSFSFWNAQTNLVPNGSFETNTICPDYPGQINYATGWNNVNLIYNNPSVGTPDYLHACGSASLGYNTVPPNTFVGDCLPHTGNAMGATIVYNVPYPDYREYMSIQLTEAMIPGLSYTVSFWITNGNPAQSPFTVKNIGAHLSTTPLSQTGWGLIGLNPTCEITGFSGTQSWVQHTFVVAATAPWQYITLGNFKNDAANTPSVSYAGGSGPISAYATYFWDDIQVLSSVSSKIKELANNDEDLRIFPNPAVDNEISVSSSNSIEEVNVINSTGSIVKSQKLVKNNDKYTVDIKDLPDGIYFMQFYNNKELVCGKRLVKQ